MKNFRLDMKDIKLALNKVHDGMSYQEAPIEQIENVIKPIKSKIGRPFFDDVNI
ncbi:hypothetical protein [Natronincola ferrireducens]|uniref:Uncharacterized protein n=1 Tax=Natronincola ferrireducens TaxID=393762 RepID=A0A1G9HE96_9FIRM|nr:hypothetical protein [Natronincola ferrireducens]SDL10803.1 hypothetical protein SAMN05660472_02629 [Natronincola ferrireducens]